MPDLTERQREILALLWLRQSAGKPCPTCREIGAALGLRSSSDPHRYLGQLEAAGLITRGLPTGDRNRIVRAIRITEAGHLALGRRLRFPLLGTVS